MLPCCRLCPASCAVLAEGPLASDARRSSPQHSAGGRAASSSVKSRRHLVHQAEDFVGPPVEEAFSGLVEDVARCPPCAPAAAWREGGVQNAGPHLPRSDGGVKCSKVPVKCGCRGRQAKSPWHWPYHWLVQLQKARGACQQ